MYITVGNFNIFNVYTLRIEAFRILSACTPTNRERSNPHICSPGCTGDNNINSDRRNLLGWPFCFQRNNLPVLVSTPLLKYRLLFFFRVRLIYCVIKETIFWYWTWLGTYFFLRWAYCELKRKKKIVYFNTRR